MIKFATKSGKKDEETKEEPINNIDPEMLSPKLVRFTSLHVNKQRTFSMAQEEKAFIPSPEVGMDVLENNQE